MNPTNVTCFEEFKTRREYRDHTEIGRDPRELLEPPKQRIFGAKDDIEPDLRAGLPIRDLYPAPDESSFLGSALERLDRASELLNRATTEHNAEDFVAADDSIQHFQAILPELFCFRKIGDGFGAIINAIWFALQNQNGKPLTLKQISIIKLAISKLHFSPFLKFETAVDVTMSLENAELVIDPPAIGHLANAAHDESVC